MSTRPTSSRATTRPATIAVDAGGPSGPLPALASHPTLPTHVDREPLDDERFVPILEALHAGGRVAFIHPTGFRAPGVLDDWLMDWTIGAPFEDTIATLGLMASGRLV